MGLDGVAWRCVLFPRTIGIMRLSLIILAICVTLSQADRSLLGNLGAVSRKLHLPDLEGAQNFLPSGFSNKKNIQFTVQSSRDSSSSSSQSQPQPFSANLPVGGSLQFSKNVKNSSQNFPFLPATGEGEISLGNINFVNKNLHENEGHIPPFPIIPFNSDKRRNSQTNSQGFQGFSSTGQGFPATGVPQPFNIDGNAPQVNPGFSNPSVGGNFDFGDNNVNFQGSHGGSTPQPFDHSQQDNTETTDYTSYPTYPSYPDEATRPALNNFTPQPSLFHNNNNFPSGNEGPLQSFGQGTEVGTGIGVDIGNRNQGFEIEVGNQGHSVEHNFEQGLSGESLEQILTREWSEFKNKFNKIYATANEENYRREVFIENRAKIQRFNMEYAEGRRNFVHRINPYADLLLHEFTSQHCGFNRSRVAPKIPTKPASAFVPSANVVFPNSVDWREVGAVGPVKTQGKCAACWAFAAAGALEGHTFRKTGNLVDVSVQNLIDCTEPYGNNGCTGGLMDPAFEYVRDNNGVDSEQSYPFEERTAQCRFKREDVVASCTGFVDIGENDEKGLEIALATLGPVTAAIDAGQDTFQFYSDGIYDDPECGNTPEKMNHAVLIVGYGTDPDGRKYWLVKNSYGPQWGTGGYIKIAKDNNNQCGIAIQASYPLV